MVFGFPWNKKKNENDWYWKGKKAPKGAVGDDRIPFGGGRRGHGNQLIRRPYGSNVRHYGGPYDSRPGSGFYSGENLAKSKRRRRSRWPPWSFRHGHRPPTRGPRGGMRHPFPTFPPFRGGGGGRYRGEPPVHRGVKYLPPWMRDRPPGYPPRMPLGRRGIRDLFNPNRHHGTRGGRRIRLPPLGPSFLGRGGTHSDSVYCEPSFTGSYSSDSDSIYSYLESEWDSSLRSFSRDRHHGPGSESTRSFATTREWDMSRREAAEHAAERQRAIWAGTHGNQDGRFFGGSCSWGGTSLGRRTTSSDSLRGRWH